MPRLKSAQRISWLAVPIIVVAALAAYANTFQVPFLFDDASSIADNATIRQLWPPGNVLSPPANGGVTVSGRPILNLSLALNYAMSGLNVGSYHALNLLIHIFAGLTLFGLVRRTLIRPPLAARFENNAAPVALLIAGLWALHPLQTEAVTYVVQRAESLMGLFFLLALYAFVRAVDSPRRRPPWQVAAFFACLLGVGTKEIAALVPLIAFFYDRTFVAGTFREAWRRRRGLYLALASTWLPLLWWTIRAGGDRGGTKGFSGAIPWADYWLTQFEAVTRYLWLSFWPHPLIFDYPKIPTPDFGAAVVWALPVVALLGATIVALKRRPVAGFLGVWFFVLLAPTSVVPATSQMIVEHRMYLPLAAVVALAIGLLAQRFNGRSLLAMGAGLALAAGAMTFQRNAVYASERGLWEETLARYPHSARAHHNLGFYFFQHGQLPEAIAQYRESLRLEPSWYTYYSLGVALAKSDRDEEAMAPLTEAIRLTPNFANAQTELGAALNRLNRASDALPHLLEGVRLNPALADGQFQTGLALAALGRGPEAIEHYAAAARADPQLAVAHSNWGVALARQNDLPGAVAHFNEALRLMPDSKETRFNLALALTDLGRTDDAIAQYSEAVRIDSSQPDAQRNLGVLLASTGRMPAGIEHLEIALKLRPDFEAHNNLALALLSSGRTAEALAHYESATRLRPQDPVAYYNQGCALLSVQRRSEAQTCFETALKIDPAFAPALEALRRARAGAPAK